MSLFTWGSTGFGTLGYITQHGVHHVSGPRQVKHRLSNKAASVTTGKSTTWVTCETGEILVSGSAYSLTPILMASSQTNRCFKLSCSDLDSYALAILGSSSYVSWIHPDGTDHVIRNSTLLCALDVACRDSTYGLVIDRKSSNILEIGSAAPILRPSHLAIISPASKVYVTCVYGAVMSSETGEIRVWDHEFQLTSKPARVIVRESDRISSSDEWVDALDGHFIKNVTSFCLPNTLNGFGYAVESARPHILLRFRLSQDQQKSPVSTIVGIPYMSIPTNLSIVSLSQNSRYVYLVDSAGNLFEISHHTTPSPPYGDLKILEQVMQISVSEHHCAAIVSVGEFIEPSSSSNCTSLPSLQRSCALSIMKHYVTVENVSSVLKSLLERAVVDLVYLLDFVYAYFARNRNLIQYICQDSFENLLQDEDFRSADDRWRRRENGDCSFTECLIQARSERVVSAGQREESVTRSTRKERRKVLSPNNAPIDQERPGPLVNREQQYGGVLEEAVSNFSIAEDFMPLENSLDLNSTVRTKPGGPRIVRKWTKCDKQKVFGDPSLTSPVVAPWSPPQMISPKTCPLPEFSLGEKQVRESRSSTPSRWFKPLSETHISTVEDAILEAIEEREVAEAVRLVEAFEEREKEKENRGHKRGRRHAQLKSIIARH